MDHLTDEQIEEVVKITMDYPADPSAELHSQHIEECTECEDKFREASWRAIEQLARLAVERDKKKSE